jgi:predicted TIM-barrel enzyme
MAKKIERNAETSAILSKDQSINDEFDRLSKIFSNIDIDKRGVALNLIQNAAFMAVSLRDLQDIIRVNGWISTYDNGGGQGGERVSPAAQQYAKMVATYNSTIKTLLDLLPKGDRDAARAQADPMAAFLAQ